MRRSMVHFCTSLFPLDYEPEKVQRMPSVSIILYALIILFIGINFCVALAVLAAMCLRRSTVKTDRLNYLLLFNGYINLPAISPFFLEMSIKSIYGQLHPDSNFDGWECRINIYMGQWGGCVYFYSFLLQALYRVCRIVYPTKMVFQSFKCYGLLSVAQWIVAAASLVPCCYLGYIQYLPNEYHCQFAPSDLHGSLIGMTGLFVIPFALTMISYLYTMYYVRTQTTALTAINREASVRRDLIILTRLVILFTLVNTIGLSHLVVPVCYAITGYVVPWAVSFTWLMTFFSLSSASIIQIFVSPHLRKLFTLSTRIRPMSKRILNANK